jgi:hypothetical protein
MQEYLLKLLGHYRKYIHEEGAAQEAPPPPPPGARGGGRGGERERERDDEALKGHGCRFDQAGFVASHRCAPLAAAGHRCSPGWQ